MTAVGELDQRFYSSQFGRFMSADRFRASRVDDSGRWNKYSYTRGDPVNSFDPSGRFDCSPDDASCDPFDCGPSDQLTGVHRNDSCYGSGGGPSPAPAPKQVPCDDPVKITQTLSDLGANIVAIFTADYNKDPGAYQNSLSTHISDIEKVLGSGTSFYQGGHFNLDLNNTLLQQDLGPDYQDFLADFGGITILGYYDGARQKALVGSTPNVLSYYVHSKLVGNDFDFHFDQFSGQNATLPLHGIWDVGIGSVFHPCLDPAWRSRSTLTGK